jgi:hypothetical protein
MPEPRSWIERLWSSIADRGRSYAEVLQPEASKVPLDRARELATALLSERGEASGAAVARELQISLHELGTADRVSFYRFLVENFLPAEAQLRAAAEAYLEANHEAFVRGAIVRSSAVDALLGSGAGLAATATSQSETRKRRPRKR